MMRTSKHIRSGSSYLADIARDAGQRYRPRPALRALLHLSPAPPLWPKNPYLPFRFSYLHSRYQGAHLGSRVPLPLDSKSLSRSLPQVLTAKASHTLAKAPRGGATDTAHSSAGGFAGDIDTSVVTIADSPVTPAGKRHGGPLAPPQSTISIPDHSGMHDARAPTARSAPRETKTQNSTDGYSSTQTNEVQQTNTGSASKKTETSPSTDNNSAQEKTAEKHRICEDSSTKPIPGADLNRFLQTLGAQLERHNFPEGEPLTQAPAPRFDTATTIATPRNGTSRCGEGFANNQKGVKYRPAANRVMQEDTSKPALLHALGCAKGNGITAAPLSLQPRLRQAAPAQMASLGRQPASAPTAEKEPVKTKARQLSRKPRLTRTITRRRSLPKRPTAFWDRHYLGQLTLRMYR